MTGSWYQRGFAATCPTCGKRCYPNKRQAKTVRKQMPRNTHLNVYRCGEYWHIGTLPKPVIAGTIDRSKILPPRRRTP